MKPSLFFNAVGDTRVAWLICATLLGANCSRKAGGTTLPTPSTPLAALGSCAAAIAPGKPADRDLNRDGAAERVRYDPKQCHGENCVFQIYWHDGQCHRYLGSVSGASLQLATDSPVGDGGFVSVRTFWKLGGSRLLVQGYRFADGGYRLTDALVCHKLPDDTLRCAER